MPQHSGLKQTLHCTIDYLHFSGCIHEAIKTLQSSNMNCTLAEKDQDQGTSPHTSFFPSYKAPFGDPSCHVTSKKSQTCTVFQPPWKEEKLAAISAHPGHRPRPRQSIMWNSVGDFYNCCCIGIIRQHLHSRLCLIRPPDESTVAFLLEPLYCCSCFEWAVFCFYVCRSLTHFL